MKRVQIRSYFWSVFSPNTGKCGPEITPYLDTFHAVLPMFYYALSQTTLRVMTNWFLPLYLTGKNYDNAYVHSYVSLAFASFLPFTFIA